MIATGRDVYNVAMLASSTPSSWVELACREIDAVLVDHAHCEKKAAASAMSLVAAYPGREELVLRMSALAMEELSHFRAVFDRLVARGLALGRDTGDPYAQRLVALARPSPDADRLVDRLLVFGLIEARSRERLALLGAHLSDPDLARFYEQLAQAEARHAEMFVDLARRYATVSVVSSRLEGLAAEEARIVAELPVAPRIH
jgi:tRNA-(ms[2]io[6]A)-hydroxylase